MGISPMSDDWTPCTRTVDAATPNLVRIRGMEKAADIYWPDAFLNAGADYAIDFSNVLCCDETIVSSAFNVTGGNLGWGGNPTFSLKKAVAWIAWNVPGKQSVEVSIITNKGNNLSFQIFIMVNSSTTLLNQNLPNIPPNTLTLPNAVPLLREDNGSILSQ